MAADEQTRRPASGAEAEPEPSFEEALERLEAIVEELEGGTLTLEESIARYEEGVRLSRRLTQTLDQAEKRIERLVDLDPSGPPTTEPMDLEAEGNESGTGRRRGTREGEQATSARGGSRSRTRPDDELDELPF